MTILRKNSLLWFAAAASFATIIFSCSNTTFPLSGNNNGGSGTGVGNGAILGTVIYPDSAPVVGAIVRLRPQNYLADTSGRPPQSLEDSIKTLRTDSAGNFSIDSVDTGRTYFIEVNDQKSRAQATLFKVSPKQGPLKLATRVVNPVASIIGEIIITGLPVSAYVQIYGLERLGRTDASGSFTFTDLPVGKCEEGECEYKLRILVPKATGGIKSIDYELEVESGGKVSIEIEDSNGDDH
jgi:hypothetical protein